MKARDFLELAKELSSVEKSANFRSSISRAYYAAYNFAYAFLREMNFTLSLGGRAHGEVPDHLANSKDVELQKRATQLKNLHADRIMADYELDDLSIESKRTAEQKCKSAEEIILSLEALQSTKSDPRGRYQAVRINIKGWKQSKGMIL